MSRYFFHVQDGRTVSDSVGLDFPDIELAREEAIRACGDILRDVRPEICNVDTLRVWVTDQPDGEGNPLFTVTVSMSAG